MNKDILEKHGIDYNDAVKRLMGNAAIFEKCLMRFPSDESFMKLKQEIEAGNCAEAFEYAHNLKGVTANLSMMALCEKATACCEELRAGNLEGARAIFPEVEKEYLNVMAVFNLI